MNSFDKTKRRERFHRRKKGKFKKRKSDNFELPENLPVKQKDNDYEDYQDDFEDDDFYEDDE